MIRHKAVDPAVDEQDRQRCSDNEEHDCVCHAYSISCSVSHVKVLSVLAE
jgi:hypothetical protein